MRSQLHTLSDRSTFTCWDLFYDCFLLFLLGMMQTKHSNGSFTKGGFKQLSVFKTRPLFEVRITLVCKLKTNISQLTLLSTFVY